jgi:hypothetical protein
MFLLTTLNILPQRSAGFVASVVFFTAVLRWAIFVSYFFDDFVAAISTHFGPTTNSGTVSPEQLFRLRDPPKFRREIVVVDDRYQPFARVEQVSRLPENLVASETAYAFLDDGVPSKLVPELRKQTP